ncbi:DedA family protein [Streptoalloteichus hindustanus]|uniref:Membrane protein DedA, SNARE-associated domain n=1 Tax=Streptoalloteichus hindustanus TaxID=2017 RepID=A0A1M5KGI8_STRHI|nr:VTT domain-containing protein [Streptoalloteichus hindustanus]SHG51912.1 membrane protein DedA, SNARE-associated domain [Streptoalloteichus hindustanus]
MPTALTDLIPDPTTLSVPVMVLLLTAVCVVEATLLLGSLVPGELVVVAAAGAAGVEWYPLVLAAAALGSVLGQLGGYLLGRASGDWVRHGWLGRRLGERRWARAEAVVRGATPLTMIAVRFVAVGHTLAPVLAGAARMQPRRFLHLAAVGSAVWAGVWAALGVAARQAGELAGSWYVATGIGLVGMVLAGATLSRAIQRAGLDAPAGDRAPERAAAADLPARA